MNSTPLSDSRSSSERSTVNVPFGSPAMTSSLSSGDGGSSGSFVWEQPQADSNEINLSVFFNGLSQRFHPGQLILRRGLLT